MVKLLPFNSWKICQSRRPGLGDQITHEEGVEGEKKKRKQVLLSHCCLSPSRDQEEHGAGEVSPCCLPAAENTRSVLTHIFSMFPKREWPGPATYTLANMKNFLCVSYWITVTRTVEASLFLSPPTSCAVFSLPSGVLNLGHSSGNRSSTLAAATAIGVAKVLEKQRGKKVHSRHK